MRLQQQLALCLLACVACTAIARTTGDEYAYDKESYGKDHYKGDDSYKEGYGKDHYKGGDSYGDYEDKPECDSKQFKMLETALCVDPESGELVKLSYSDEECTIDKDGWCMPVEGTKWGCAYKYVTKGTTCRKAAGPCDMDDTCSGESAECKDTVKAKDTVCLKSESVCIKDAKCDGVAKTCPTPKNVAKGTPCKSDGIYTEAYGEDGTVALQSTVDAEIAKKHGWGTCHRCYEGECTAFKYEWYKNKNTKKHGKKNSHNDDMEMKHEKKSEESKKMSEEHKKKMTEKYDEDDEWYVSKHDTEEYAKLEGYEPQVYCKRNEDKSY